MKSLYFFVMAIMVFASLVQARLISENKGLLESFFRHRRAVCGTTCSEQCKKAGGSHGKCNNGKCLCYTDNDLSHFYIHV
ncbi:unnamed protein product [Brassicogethes aeneus]|uniref:Uncharacterized protein n=1 Tax=Brassicogethes aeneus TaxID=1431903 RepID=A0A9P0B1L6_BRAAE|nr:unnamed protein product [Brassicogethes aeneus]